MGNRPGRVAGGNRLGPGHHRGRAKRQGLAGADRGRDPAGQDSAKPGRQEDERPRLRPGPRHRRKRTIRIRREQVMNMVKTTVLMAALFAVFMLAGQVIGGEQGMIMAFGIALVTNFFSYWFSDKMVLMMYRAQPVTQEQAPQIYRAVSNLAQRAKIPMPKIYVIPSESPNAFATGRNPEHASVCFTESIVQI